MIWHTATITQFDQLQRLIGAVAALQELQKVIVDQQWVIGTVGFTPTLRVVSNKMGNVPDRYAWKTRVRTPGAAHPSTYFFKS